MTKAVLLLFLLNLTSRLPTTASFKPVDQEPDSRINCPLEDDEDCFGSAGWKQRYFSVCNIFGECFPEFIILYICISFRSGEQPIEEEEKEKPKSYSQCRQYLNSDNRASLFKVFKWTGWQENRLWDEMRASKNLLSLLNLCSCSS